MTIQNKTARNLLYDWHGGQWSAFYAAASSGLVESFDALRHESKCMSEPDKTKLADWLEKKANKHNKICINNRFYAVLPWVSKSNYSEV